VTDAIVMAAFTAFLTILKVTGIVPLTWVDIAAPTIVYFVVLGLFFATFRLTKAGRMTLIRILAKDI